MNALCVRLDLHIPIGGKTKNQLRMENTASYEHPLQGVVY
jgi:hypothetical protein